MKRSLLIVWFAALLGGCASTEVAHRYIDHTAVMTEAQKTSRLHPYSGATEIQATETPFATMAAMADRGYFLLGEASMPTAASSRASNWRWMAPSLARMW